MEARATLKYIRISPQKARLVVDLIRGKNVSDALSVLAYTKKRVTQAVEKVLRSAIANAEQKSEHVDVDQMFVSKVLCERGTTIQESSPCTHGPRVSVPAADQPYHGRGRISGIVARSNGRYRAGGDGRPNRRRERTGGLRWVRRFILMGSAWVITRPGSRGGSRRRITRSFFTRTSRLRNG